MWSSGSTCLGHSKITLLIPAATKASGNQNQQTKMLQTTALPYNIPSRETSGCTSNTPLWEFQTWQVTKKDTKCSAPLVLFAGFLMTSNMLQPKQTARCHCRAWHTSQGPPPPRGSPRASADRIRGGHGPEAN